MAKLGHTRGGNKQSGKEGWGWKRHVGGMIVVTRSCSLWLMAQLSSASTSSSNEVFFSSVLNVTLCDLLLTVQKIYKKKKFLFLHECKYNPGVWFDSPFSIKKSFCCLSAICMPQHFPGNTLSFRRPPPKSLCPLTRIISSSGSAHPLDLACNLDMTLIDRNA